tara:strand:- start:3239 stop:3868 length:630 start_codon:yes stop_codon:yes gene_type:complete
MDFKDKITYYISTTDGYTDAEAQQYIIDGCYDVYRKFKSLEGSDTAQKFGVWSDPAITNGTAIDIDEVHEIIYVQRNGIPAIQVSPSNIHKYTDVDSMHYASANDPVYYFQEQYMTVKPAPDGSNPLYYIFLPTYAVTAYDGPTSSIDKFPAEYYDYVLKYAAYKIAEALAHNYMEDEEDAELNQLMTGRAGALKVEYMEMFSTGGTEQ